MLVFLHAHAALIMGVLFGMDEVLAQIPQVKANSTYQLVSGIIAKINAMLNPPSSGAAPSA